MATNHPNRSRRGSPAANPTPAEIRGARMAAGLTQSEAAALIYSTLRTWQDWEAGIARMHPALWELFKIAVGLGDRRDPARRYTAILSRRRTAGP